MDNFSDISEQSDIEDSDIDLHYSDTDIYTNKKRAIVLHYSSSDEETNDEDREDMSDDQISEIKTEIDIPPDLENFLGNSQINVVVYNPNNILEIVSLFFGDDLFEFMANETNRYHFQNEQKFKTNIKSGTWKHVNCFELKRFMSLILLMGLVRKDARDDYWSTDPTIETPIFSKVMSRNRFNQIWTNWHFCNNEEMDESSDKLFKITPVLSYFVSKFKTIYIPKQELSLDENIIPWRGPLSFKVYNAGKLIKYGLFVRMVCEASSGYIGNLEIYSTKCKGLSETITSILLPFENVWHHVYMDNYYTSMETCQKLLDSKFRICGTIRRNKSVPSTLKNQKGESKYLRNKNILTQIWRSKRVVRMISSIHSARMIESHNKDKKTRKNIYKPECVIQYNKYMKGVERADQYLAYYSILRTKKWTKRVILYLINCAFFNAYRVFNFLNVKKIKYKEFLHELARQWISTTKDSMNIKEET